MHAITPALRLVVLALILACDAAFAFEREKSDIVTLRNGDRITGEIVALRYGILDVKTSSMGTLHIEWPAVGSLQSQYTFFVEHIDGRQYFGRIRTDAAGKLVIGAQDADDPAIPIADVARVSQVDSGFWQRIEGVLSVGYNFTQSTDISVGSVNFNAAYTSRRTESTLRVSALTTKSPDSGSSDRDQIAYGLRFLRPGNDYWMLLSALDRNEELGIEGRLQVGAAAGRHFVQRSYTLVSGIAGLALTQEWIMGSEGAQRSIEGVLGGEWRIFRFATPETSLHSSLLLFPNLSESGRYRSELNLTLRRDLIDDLTFDLSYYNSHDSDPPDDAAASSDYGIVTSLGYKF